MTELIHKIISKSSRGTVIFLPKVYREKISRVEKYAQIGQISSGLLHDLTSPITALNLQLETLDAEMLKNPKYLQSIKDAVVNINNYSSLIKSYISGDRTKQKLNLSDEIQKAIELISYKAVKENIQIQFIRNEDIDIMARKIEIYQIIISLLSNAIESFRIQDENRKVIIKLEKIQNKILLSIKDYGCGINDTKKIFSNFYTTKRSSGGTGIGLSSVKHIVEKELNGKIEIESEIEKGSTFIIKI
jgi:signal transduction histidine kinase